MNYIIKGKVVKGHQLGRTWGIPTINIMMDSKPEELLNGVYFSKVYMDSKEYYGVTNIGVKPTIQGVNRMSAETYIYNCSGNLYDKEVTVELMYFNRPERQFDSLDSLKNRIKQDMAEGESYFNIIDNNKLC